MAQRVRLTWNRNQDLETKSYRVYRSENPDILPFNRQEHLVMKVTHPDQINPITVEDETLERYSERTYLLEHENILTDYNGTTYPFVIEVNGAAVVNFLLDTVEGLVLFDDPLEESDIVVAKTYTFDGVRAWDYEIIEAIKSYYGPEAKDNSAPFPPTNVTMTPDYDRNRIIIEWRQSNPNGKKFYYRIDAAASETHYSGLSEWKTAILKEPLADRPYLVERSTDGVEWKQVARIKQNHYYEYMIDREAPNPVRDLTGSFFMYSGNNLAKVTLEWSRISDNLWSQTSLYRIRAVNKVGAVSDPSPVVGPIPFKVGLKEIVVRRKLYDGVLPSFDGADAVTVATLTDINITTIDDDVEDNSEYVYAVWVVDAGGNRSPLSFVRVNVGDNTAPFAPTNITVDEFQLIVG